VVLAPVRNVGTCRPAAAVGSLDRWVPPAVARENPKQRELRGAESAARSPTYVRRGALRVRCCVGDRSPELVDVGLMSVAFAWLRTRQTPRSLSAMDEQEPWLRRAEQTPPRVRKRQRRPALEVERTPTKPGRRRLPLEGDAPIAPLTMRDHRVRERVNPPFPAGFPIAGAGFEPATFGL
jgi:hypothetical protein